MELISLPLELVSLFAGVSILMGAAVTGTPKKYKDEENKLPEMDATPPHPGLLDKKNQKKLNAFAEKAKSYFESFGEVSFTVMMRSEDEKGRVFGQYVFPSKLRAGLSSIPVIVDFLKSYRQYLKVSHGNSIIEKIYRKKRFKVDFLDQKLFYPVQFAEYEFEKVMEEHKKNGVEIKKNSKKYHTPFHFLGAERIMVHALGKTNNYFYPLPILSQGTFQGFLYLVFDARKVEFDALQAQYAQHVKTITTCYEEAPFR